MTKDENIDKYEYRYLGFYGYIKNIGKILMDIVDPPFCPLSTPPT